MEWLNESFTLSNDPFSLRGVIRKGCVQISLHYGRQSAILFEKQYSSLNSDDADADVVRQYFAAKIAKYLNGYKKLTSEQARAKHGFLCNRAGIPDPHSGSDEA